MNVRTAIILGALAIVALPLLWIVAGKMHRFAYWIGRKTDAEVAALANNGWQLDRLQVADGVELVGLVRPPKNANARWLLFVPGNSSDLLRGFQEVLDDLRGDDDVGIAFWAYRGFDASGGTPDPAALRADLDKQWQRMVQLGAKPATTEVWGYSLGSMLAPHLAASLCRAKTPPQRLVLLATGMEIPVCPHGTLGRFGSSDVFECASVAADVTCPVAIAQGTDDPAMPIAGARELAKGFGIELTELQGKGHVDLWPAVREQVWGR